MRHKIGAWVSRHRTLLLRGTGAAVTVLLLVQIFYPGDKMPLFATVDGVDVSGWSKKDTVKKLDTIAARQAIDVEVGNTGASVSTTKIADIGLRVANDQRIDEAGAPWYIRLIPTSLFWFGPLQKEATPMYSTDTAKAEAYLNKIVGESCVIAPVDATLRMTDDRLTVVRAKSGGSCKKDEALKSVVSVRPVIGKKTSIRIPVAAVAPEIGDEKARVLADELNTISRNGVKLTVAGKQQTIPQKEILSWLTFKTAEDALVFDVSTDASNAYMAKNVTPTIAKPAGVTKVSTLDFTETSRNEGPTGQTLNLQATLNDIKAVLTKEKSVASAVSVTVAPKVQYSRQYTKSSTGIAAQIRFYDEDNTGVFGVSFQELGGQGLSAQHNGGRQFVTASTYKLFVAFSVLKRVDAGQMKWEDANIASGRNLSACFDDMIVKSDNACAEALIKKVGASSLNADIKSLGLGSTAFRSDNNMTTASDLANYLTQLEKGTMPLKPESRSRLLSVMKRNVYRQGVPSGASGQTADKVGFLWGLLHDAAIVYSPKGTYVLAVMTDGSSWGSIAELTRKIEALR